MTAKKMDTYIHGRMSVQMQAAAAPTGRQQRKAVAGSSAKLLQAAAPNPLNHPFCIGVVKNSESCGAPDLWQAIRLQAAQPELTQRPVTCKHAQNWLTPRRLLTMVRPSGADRAASASTMALTEYRMHSRLLTFSTMLFCLAGVGW